MEIIISNKEAHELINGEMNYFISNSKELNDCIFHLEDKTFTLKVIFSKAAGYICLKREIGSYNDFNHESIYTICDTFVISKTQYLKMLEYFKSKEFDKDKVFYLYEVKDFEYKDKVLNLKVISE